MSDLIDTTEMYLKTIYELIEDGVTPMRARIVDRLGHSGPTVSQTIARMERDGLVKVASDRRLDLTEKGFEVVTEVVRKHRLAERLLVDIIGLDWKLAHDEACRWEHVMSDAVEERIGKLLDNVERDPYGNPIPYSEAVLNEGVSLAKVREELPANTTVIAGIAVDRIGEPIQADGIAMRAFSDMGLRPGKAIYLSFEKDSVDISYTLEESKDRKVATLPIELEPHFFVVDC
ncbi:metal-dependent transcriptional regulator [Gleimia coleocanis]|uniref:metal-dependent transcriptional regulator n=1 Tax=Gleimia coleocanis TaxID=103618 RepID=UPI00059128D1|nr:metal-dependent transcriptional regulator [Gleimia coleocanis]